jgi:transglutaminase-like putative cysteine protease
MTFSVEPGTVLALQVAPATSAGVRADEQFTVTLDGRLLPVEEIPSDHGGRIHIVRSDAGALRLIYSSTVHPVTAPGPAAVELDVEAIQYLRQSRYCPSDAMIGFAGAELGHLTPGPGLVTDIADWVFERLAYVLGMSTPTTTALETLAANAGACRDFAHLTIALCRARGVPARLAAVYAPGLTPMDFHAVVEARVDGVWHVLDATRMAPRSSLVRIATGRDAADTAFATTLAGDAELLTFEVTATTDGDLPADDHRGSVTLA